MNQDELIKSFYYKRGKTAVLLLHGYTSTCYPLKDLGKFLADKNISSYAPLLPGHGTKPEDLENIKIADWEASIEEAYQKLKEDYKKIYIVGVSFGGNLAFSLAAKFDIDAVISVGSPIWISFHRPIKLLLPIYSQFFKYYNKPSKNKYKKERGYFGKYYAYTKIPLKNLKEFFRWLEKKTRYDLPKVKCPVLIIQSISDKVVKPKSAVYIYNKLCQTNQKKLIWIDGKEHVVTIGGSKIQVFDEIYQFINQNQ